MVSKSNARRRIRRKLRRKQHYKNNCDNITWIQKVSDRIPVGLLNLVYSFSCFRPEKKEELKSAIIMWEFNPEKALKIYGNIEKWDTSKITDMSWLFACCPNFNRDISKWNTSNVTNMTGMFFEAYNFNQDIRGWDTSKVTNMSFMFQRALSFNKNISEWNISEVTTMKMMFNNARLFNQNINKWNTTNVTDMRYMFDAIHSMTIPNWYPDVILINHCVD